MSYDSKNELVQARKLKVQKLSIPFALTANATPASVVLRNDEPAIMFLQSEGVNQITAALDTNETATYATSPVDANGTMNILVKVRETVLKVVSARMCSRITGVAQPLFIGSASGITTGSGGGKSIMLTLDSAVNHATTDVDASIEVEYVLSE